MNIEAKEFEIKMTHNELWSTAWDVKHYFLHTVKTHWINHQDNWKSNESERLIRMRNMFYALGKPDIYHDTMTEAENILKDLNSKAK